MTAGGAVGQWWTPPWLAEAAARWARIGPGVRVLDPGAGRASLTLAALRLGATVTAIERDERLVEDLRALEPQVRVLHADFFSPPCDPRQLAIPGSEHGYDVALENPPWEGKWVERFLRRSLELAPRVVGIVPLNVLAGVGRAGRMWSWMRVTRLKPLARRAKFGGKGGGMRDVALLEVVLRDREREPGEIDVVEMEVGE